MEEKTLVVKSSLKCTWLWFQDISPPNISQTPILGWAMGVWLGGVLGGDAHMGLVLKPLTIAAGKQIWVSCSAAIWFLVSTCQFYVFFKPYIMTYPIRSSFTITYTRLLIVNIPGLALISIYTLYAVDSGIRKYNKKKKQCSDFVSGIMSITMWHDTGNPGNCKHDTIMSRFKSGSIK